MLTAVDEGDESRAAQQTRRGVVPKERLGLPGGKRGHLWQDNDEDRNWTSALEDHSLMGQSRACLRRRRRKRRSKRMKPKRNKRQPPPPPAKRCCGLISGCLAGPVESNLEPRLSATAQFWVTSCAEVSGSSSRWAVMSGNTVGGIAEGFRNGEYSRTVHVCGLEKTRSACHNSGRRYGYKGLQYTVPLPPGRQMDGRRALISIGIGIGIGMGYE